MNGVPLWSSVPDDFQDQVYRSFNNAIPGTDSLAIGTLHGTSPQNADLAVARVDGSVASRYGRSEDPFLLNYDASRGVVASASHSPGHLMPRTYAPQFISGLGYQGTNWRPFDAFRRHYPNATLHNRSDTGSGPSNAPTPGLAVAHDLYPSWTQSEIPYRGQSFMFPYMTDGTISDSLTPEHPIATENGATAASLTNPIVLTFNAEMSDKNYPISPLSIASMSGANPSLIVSAPFKQQPDPSKSFFTNTVPTSQVLPMPLRLI
ncbi:hypothetical protein CPB85DRAFT_1252186 [Mucidula mucida]|nr:hypothetical protein CPB85DRAFT_1252186 [Mucidula mucida]